MRQGVSRRPVGFAPVPFYLSDDLGETGIANHHEVDVATRTLRTTGHGAEDEGRVDPAGGHSRGGSSRRACARV